MLRLTRGLTLTLSLAALAACDPLDPHDPAALAPDASSAAKAASSAVNPGTAEAISAMIETTNAGLESAGSSFRVARAEYITASESHEAGIEVLAKNVGNKHLSADFVPFDPRREAFSGPLDGAIDDITYAIDQTSDAAPLVGASAAEATAAIVAAMDSWEAVRCSSLGIRRADDQGLDLGLQAFLLSGGVVGGGEIVADVMHAGWRDLNFAGGVLGVTFTFVWGNDIDGVFVPTDIDGNGLNDVAFREIYYDPIHPTGVAWPWNIGSNIDIESVAVHEAGHALSQGHFGMVFLKNDGSLAASPRAVMNALYAAPFPALTGSDLGGHCSNWANWPNG